MKLLDLERVYRDEVQRVDRQPTIEMNIFATAEEGSKDCRLVEVLSARQLAKWRANSRLSTGVPASAEIANATQTPKTGPTCDF